MVDKKIVKEKVPSITEVCLLEFKKMLNSGRMVLFCNNEENTFVSFSNKGVVEILDISSKRFKNYISKIIYELRGKILSDIQIKSIINTLTLQRHLDIKPACF